MGVISKDENEIKLYYNSHSSIGMQVLGYVEAAERKILPIDISKTKVTGTQWAEIAKGLGLPISDLINKEHPDYAKYYDRDADLDDEDWLKIIDKSPQVISTPIAIIGERYVQVPSPADFVKYLEPDSKDVGNNH